MSILESNRNVILLKTSASLLVEYIYFAINHILFVRGYSTLTNFTIQYHFGMPIWILNDEKLSLYVKPQLKSLKGMLANRSVRKVFLYLRDSGTNEIAERWDLEAECEDDGNGSTTGNNDDARNGIRDVFRQICSTASCLPALTLELKYTVTVKMEESSSSNVDALQTPRTWFGSKNYGQTPNAQWY